MLILDKQRDGGDLTAKNLELDIENWIRARTNTPVTFNSDQSIEFLRKLGTYLNGSDSLAQGLCPVQVFSYTTIPCDQTVSK